MSGLTDTDLYYAFIAGYEAGSGRKLEEFGDLRSDIQQTADEYVNEVLRKEKTDE